MTTPIWSHLVLILILGSLLNRMDILRHTLLVSTKSHIGPHIQFIRANAIGHQSPHMQIITQSHVLPRHRHHRSYPRHLTRPPEATLHNTLHIHGVRWTSDPFYLRALVRRHVRRQRDGDRPETVSWIALLLCEATIQTRILLQLFRFDVRSLYQSVSVLRPVICASIVFLFPMFPNVVFVVSYLLVLSSILL